MSGVCVVFLTFLIFSASMARSARCHVCFLRPQRGGRWAGPGSSGKPRVCQAGSGLGGRGSLAREAAGVECLHRLLGEGSDSSLRILNSLSQLEMSGGRGTNTKHAPKTKTYVFFSWFHSCLRFSGVVFAFLGWKVSLLISCLANTVFPVLS